MNPEIKPIGKQNFESVKIFPSKTTPPETVITTNGNKINVQKNYQLSTNELSVIMIISQTIEKYLTSESFLFAFDSLEIQSFASKVQSLQGINVDNILGGLWIKTKELAHTIITNQDEIKDETRWQFEALRRTFESMYNSYTNKVPYQVVFTNRQVQALQTYGEKISNLAKEI